MRQWVVLILVGMGLVGVACLHFPAADPAASAPASATAFARASASSATSTTAPTARDWVARVARQVEGIGDHPWGFPRAYMVRLWGRAGDYAAARKFMAQFEPRDVACLTALAEEQARWTDYDAAKKTAGQIGSTMETERVLVRIVEMQAAFDLAGAQATADTITTPGWRAWAYGNIFAVQARSSGVKAALAAADALKDKDCRAGIYRAIVKVQILAGDDAGADRTARSLGLEELKRLKGLMGEWKLARPFARLLADPLSGFWCGEAPVGSEDGVGDMLRVAYSLAPALAVGGDPQAPAKAVAAALKEAEFAHSRPLAYTYVALTQLELGDKDGAKASAAKAIQCLGYGRNDAYRCAPRLAAAFTRAEGIEVAAALTDARNLSDHRHIFPAIGYAAFRSGRIAELNALVAKRGYCDDSALLLAGAAWAALEAQRP
jgi:hypothetical protein